MIEFFFPIVQRTVQIYFLKHIIMEEKKEAREEWNREKLANWRLGYGEQFYASWAPALQNHAAYCRSCGADGNDPFPLMKESDLPAMEALADVIANA